MNERLDHLVEELAASPTDRSLDHLQAQVTRGIAGRQAQARTAAALAPVRVASIGIALAMGVTVGGVAAVSSSAGSRSVAALSMTADLAPSTLLERP